MRRLTADSSIRSHYVQYIHTPQERRCSSFYMYIPVVLRYIWDSNFLFFFFWKKILSGSRIQFTKDRFSPGFGSLGNMAPALWLVHPSFMVDGQTSYGCNHQQINWPKNNLFSFHQIIHPPKLQNRRPLGSKCLSNNNIITAHVHEISWLIT